MLTVPEAARRAGKNPETIRRWIREGKLRSTKVGTQHILEEQDLDALLDLDSGTLPIPPEWQKTFWGGPMPDFVGARTEFSLTSDQLRRVRVEARRRRVPIEVVVRDAVDRAL